MQENYEHISVLCAETIAPLVLRKTGIFVDATLGGGGHLAKMLAEMPEAKFIAFDQDEEAIARASSRFKAEISDERVKLVHANFAEIKAKLAEYSLAGVDGLIADLGFSSFQMDDPRRGFAIRVDGELDMRMNQSSKLTAAEIVNNWSEEELTSIFREYGEENYARPIAQKIIVQREEKAFERTQELANCVLEMTPEHKRRRIHPATRIFQALRIAVNDEMGVLREFLAQIPEILNPGAPAAIISFHSLEDRAVKERFRFLANKCVCPPEFPECKCEHPRGILKPRKPITPRDSEIDANPRARSAKLRIFYKNKS